MRYICYKLSMPRNTAWNGEWTGKGILYARIHKLYDRAFKNCTTHEKELIGNSYYYDFEDGWQARIDVSEVSEKEAKSISKKSKGFYGYDWMIQSLINTGSIQRGSYSSPLISHNII